MAAASELLDGDRGVRRYGVLIIVLVVGSAVAGGVGEFLVPSQLIVATDAEATARNVLASNGLYRLSIVAWFVEALLDVGLTVTFYALVRRTGREPALLAAFLRLLGTGVFAAGELFYAAPLVILGASSTIPSVPPEQLSAMALLSFRIYGSASAIANGFYGAGTAVVGALQLRSGEAPRWAGALMAIGGVGFALGTVLSLVAPAVRAGGLVALSAAAIGVGALAWGASLARAVTSPSASGSSERSHRPRPDSRRSST